jgi:protein-tyrosine-phosphatase
VLFACGQNSVRSPIAAALARDMFGGQFVVASAGVRKGDIDGFAIAAMAEVGIDITDHQPQTFEELEDWEGLDFDLIVTLAPEAHHKAIELTHRLNAAVEYWPTADATAIEGNREQRLDAYRTVRDQLMARIKTRFANAAARNA